MGKRNRPVADRFWEKVNKTESCWLWTAYKNVKGYGVFALPGANNQILAHRFAYEFRSGPIPQGKEIDHKCRVRACVNPDHLEAVSHAVNVARGETLAAIAARRTHCLKGHPFSGSNLLIWNGHGQRKTRVCKSCQDDRSMLRRLRSGKSLRRITSRLIELAVEHGLAIPDLYAERPPLPMLVVHD